MKPRWPSPPSLIRRWLIRRWLIGRRLTFRQPEENSEGAGDADEDDDRVDAVQAYRDRASYTPERYLIVRPLSEEGGVINNEVVERISSVLRQRSPSLAQPIPTAATGTGRHAAVPPADGAAPADTPAPSHRADVRGRAGVSGRASSAAEPASATEPQPAR